MKTNRKHPLPPPSEQTRTILAHWQQMNTYRLPDSVCRSVVQNARLANDMARREDSTRLLWTQYRIGTAQLIALGCLIPDTLDVRRGARQYCPAPNADYLLSMAIRGQLSPRVSTENTEILSRDFKMTVGRPRPKGMEIGGQHGA